MTLDPVAIAAGVGPVLSDPTQQEQPKDGAFDAVFADAQGAEEGPHAAQTATAQTGPAETPWASLVWTPGALELDAPTPAGVVASASPQGTLPVDVSGASGELPASALLSGTLEALASTVGAAQDAVIAAPEATGQTIAAKARPAGAHAPKLDAKAEVQGLDVAAVTKEAPRLEDLLGEDVGQKLHRELLTDGLAQGGQGALSAGSSPRAQTTQQPIDLVAAAMEPPPELVPTPPSDRVVRLKLDQDLEIQIATRDQHVDVLLHGDMKRVEALLALGPELRAELDRSGFTLGDLTGRDQSGANAQGGGHERSPSSPKPAPAAATSAAQVVAPAPVRHDGLVSALA